MTQIEEFALQIAEYKERQEVAKQAEKRFNETKDSLKSYMEAEGLTEVVVGHDVVTLQEVTRETVDSKVAKVVIPKKYLDQIVKVSCYKRLLVAPVKD